MFFLLYEQILSENEFLAAFCIADIYDCLNHHPLKCLHHRLMFHRNVGTQLLPLPFLSPCVLCSHEVIGHLIRNFITHYRSPSVKLFCKPIHTLAVATLVPVSSHFARLTTESSLCDARVMRLEELLWLSVFISGFIT